VAGDQTGCNPAQHIKKSEGCGGSMVGQRVGNDQTGYTAAQHIKLKGRRLRGQHMWWASAVAGDQTGYWLYCGAAREADSPTRELVVGLMLPADSL
jgi:hypothetical protein